ncbi:hypothetical protein HYH02_004028 [Chlamydomonas schloesseri]|uniref:Uncharacterized protein n=1 Tax=Chlamydomonas schloesseri TaxID=2026947 RepID=A0A835WQ97_9CHLO|nr:hypothetical protein HYH02_004028 [Chlamydomonas schloesseri]|eukprot:KAG2451429.1 hypothetical protein HYH02_004028 [Chlamydomonas schloesseri]
MQQSTSAVSVAATGAARRPAPAAAAAAAAAGGRGRKLCRRGGGGGRGAAVAQLAAEVAVLFCFVLLLTPHTEVARAQVLDMASGSGGGGGNASSGAVVLDAINAAQGDISSVADQFKASRETVQEAKDKHQEAADAAAAEVVDVPKTGINETMVAEFLANFRANFGSGANLQAIQDIAASSSVKQLTDLGTTVYNTLVSAAQLGITALTAGPFAVIGLLVIGLGLASAITSLVAGTLYASASAVGLYVSIAAAINNECAPADNSTSTTTSTGTTPVPNTGGGGGGSGGGGGTGPSPSPSPSSSPSPSPSTSKKHKQPRPAVNCFDAAKQAGWLSSLSNSANEMNKYLMPYVWGGGLDDGLLRITEGLLDQSIKIAKSMRLQQEQQVPAA